MMHLMIRNRFALGKFVAIMLVVVFLVSIPAAFVGTQASNQKQAAIREAMDEVLARIKEKSMITLDDYEELRDILDGASGAGKYELDINVVHPHEHQAVDDISVMLPLPDIRVDVPFAPGTGEHVHDESCLAHNRFGQIIDYKLRCGPGVTGAAVIDGHECTPCTDGRYIISDISLVSPTDKININDVYFPANGQYETGNDGYKYLRLKTSFTITYANGETVTYNGFQGNLNGTAAFGPTIRFSGTPEATLDESENPYMYTLPSDAVLYFYGYSDDWLKTSFFKPGSQPSSGTDEFVRSSMSGVKIYKAVKCPDCGHYYIAEDNSTLIGSNNGVSVYRERCPYCAKAFTNYETNYDDDSAVIACYGENALTGFQLKGIHPDGNEELITDWTYDEDLFAESTGQFDIEITYSKDDTARCATSSGTPLDVPVTNRFTKTLHIDKSLCSCTNAANHPDGKILYYHYDDSADGQCPYCSQKAQGINLGRSNVFVNTGGFDENLSSYFPRVSLNRRSGSITVPYVGAGASAQKGWTYEPASDEWVRQKGLPVSSTRTYYRIKAWDYFNYTVCDPETGSITTLAAEDNELETYVVFVGTLKVCSKCGHRYDLNEDGSDPGCPYCAKKIKEIKVYNKGTTTRPATVTVMDYDWGTSEDIAAAFDVIATYNDGHTENLSETHPEWLVTARPGEAQGTLEPVAVQPGRQTVTIALMGTDDSGRMLADTSVGVYVTVDEGYAWRSVSVVNHNCSDTATVIQRVYKCPNRLPASANCVLSDEIAAAAGTHYIIADENGIAGRCPTCGALITDIECTINPMRYQVSEFGWDDVEGTLLSDTAYFKAKTADGVYHDLAPGWRTGSSANAGSLVDYFIASITSDYTPAPGIHTATITMTNPVISRKSGSGYASQTPKFYGPDGTEYATSPNGEFSRTFEVEIFQDIYKCNECNGYYHAASDGSDPGCPACALSIVGLRAAPGTYMTSNIDTDFDFPSIFTIYAVYSDGSESATYEDSTGTHRVSDICSFVAKEGEPTTYTVTFDADIRYTMCDKYGTPAATGTKHEHATTEVHILPNITQCEVCGHYYAGTSDGETAECPYCAAKIESMTASATTITCSIADLEDLSGFFRLYGTHPSRTEEPSEQYPEGRTLGGRQTNIPVNDCVLEYSNGQLSITYRNSTVAHCLTETGAPNNISINDTFALTINVNLTGKAKCPRCHYYYDLGEDAANYTSGYDLQAHCPYCDYVFKTAEGTVLDGFHTTGFKSYSVTDSSALIEPGTGKVLTAMGTQAAPSTHAIIEKGLGTGQILEDLVVERNSDPGHSLSIEEGNVSWLSNDNATVTVRADSVVNDYNPNITGFQTFTARYTVTFRAYTSASAVTESEITQACDIKLYLDVYDKCLNCSRLFNARGEITRCPHCSLDHITVTPGSLSEELGILRSIRSRIAVIASFADGHTEAITSDDNTTGNDYTDDFDPNTGGDQTVTISLTDVFDATKTATVDVGLMSYWVCPHCLQRYEVDPSAGSTPVCAECAGTYTQLIAEPATLRLEWSPGMSADAIKEHLTVRVRTRDEQWHVLGAGDYTTDFLPSRGTGERAVTITATDAYNNTVTNSVNVILYKKYRCDICELEYDASPDGSDPGCPVCPTYVVGYEAGLTRTTYNVDEEPELYFRCVYRDGHKEDKLAQTTNNFDSASGGEKELVFSYLGESISGGTYTVINTYLVTCPACGHEHDSRYVTYNILEAGYCPDCETQIVSLQARPSNTWLVPGTVNRVYYGTEPDIIVELVDRAGRHTRVYDYQINDFNIYNTVTTQTMSVTAFGHTGTLEILVIRRGSAEDIASHGGPTEADITIDGVGYVYCNFCKNYYRADLTACPYCDFANKYGAFIDNPDANPGFKIKAGSTEYQAFSNVINGDAELIVLDEILDRLYSIPEIIDQVKVEPDVNRKADLLGLTGENRAEYLKAYADFAVLEAMPTHTDAQLGQMAYLRSIIDRYEAPGIVLNENDIVIVMITKIRPNVFDYINNLFSENYEATYFTASAIISKRY